MFKVEKKSSKISRRKTFKTSLLVSRKPSLLFQPSNKLLLTARSKDMTQLKCPDTVTSNHALLILKKLLLMLKLLMLTSRRKTSKISLLVSRRSVKS